MSFHPVFANVVGQSSAKTLLSQSLDSLKNGGETVWPLLVAQGGGGKSKLGRAFLDGARAMGVHTHFFNSPEEFRADGENWETLCNLISLANDGERVMIGLDEYHLIKNRATVRMEAFHSLLMKCADKGNSRKALPWQGETVTLNRGNITFVLMTNFPEELDKSGAFQSRFDRVELDPYSVSELTEILQVMLTNEGFQPANENTLAMIAKCGRGTARPMEKIVDRLKIAHNASGKATKTINRQDVIEALLVSKMYPQGLADWEVKLLGLCKANPKIDQVILSSLPNVEAKALRKGKGYLIDKNFAVQTRGGFQTTTIGGQYLDAIKKEGFAVA